VRIRRWAALVLAAPVAAAAGAAPSRAVTAADAPGTIVLASDRDGDWEIYAVNPDGTGLTQLTHNEFEDSSPVPSPDGTLIAFSSDAGGAAVMNAGGSGRRSIRGCSTTFSWSPDSRRVVCDAAGADAISVADVATGAVTRIAETGEDPAWSPDGRSIAFADRGLWLVSPDGGPRRRLGRRIVEGQPSWSPDSGRLAYAARIGDGDDLFTIAADGSGERRLAKNVDGFDAKDWSPRGSLIAFRKNLAHGGGAVYTVRPDGTGLRRLAGSAAGELSGGASWSPDGSALVYERERYEGAEQSDVFIAAPAAGPAHAVTSPFPSGGTNEKPRWRTGPRLTTPPARPRTVVLPRPRTLTFPSPIRSFAADGGRVAFSDWSCRYVVWQPLARRRSRTPPLCDPELSPFEVALAGTRLATLSHHFGNTEDYAELETARVGERRATVVTIASAYSGDGFSTFDSGITMHHLRGAGRTIAFTSSRYAPVESRTAWLLLARHGEPCPASVSKRPALCRRLSGAEGGVTAAVDAGRVVTVAPGGLVRLLATSGKLLRSWTLGGGIVEARLRGRTLAVQRGTSVALYDTITGAETVMRALVRDEGSAMLLDVQGDLVAYATGGAIHLLRPSDGRDLALALPRAAPPLDAELEPTGLFVSWTRMFDRRPGRVAFVPLGAMERVVARAGW
jgi:Tol biopolymer transport system component